MKVDLFTASAITQVYDAGQFFKQEEDGKTYQW